MNDSMSILLATTILALGGLGLYMYKATDKSENDGEEEYNEDSIFGSNFWGSTDDKTDDLEEVVLEEYDDDYKPRKRGKTLKNRKASGSSRRRY